MHTLDTEQHIPVYTLDREGLPGNKTFRMLRPEGAMNFRPDSLFPHRKDYYHLVFVRHGSSRHWVDMTPYVLKDNTFYFTTPSQIQIKEDPKPLWATAISFTNEFLALQENAVLTKLPIIRNPQNGHELPLSDADVAVVEDLLAKMMNEYHRPGEWQQPMITAYLTALLTYLSRLYTENFKNTSPEQLLVQKYQAKIKEYFRELHEVSEYASLLNISAGHLSEVVKAQSGKPPITHIHERLILEARRLLFHSQNAIKEIAFELGFSDASYFNRFFKRETGITPAEYRTNTRKMSH